MATTTKNRIVTPGKSPIHLLRKPMIEMSNRELKLAQVMLGFADFYDMPSLFRDLNAKATTSSFDELCDMLHCVESYNDYNPKKVIKVLERHMDCIDTNTMPGFEFGREYSPVLYVPVKYNIFDKDETFLPRMNAFATDMRKSGKAQEVQWMFRSSGLDGYLPTEKLERCAEVWDNSKNTVVDCKIETVNHFRMIRFWWD